MAVSSVQGRQMPLHWPSQMSADGQQHDNVKKELLFSSDTITSIKEQGSVSQTVIKYIAQAHSAQNLKASKTRPQLTPAPPLNDNGVQRLLRDLQAIEDVPMLILLVFCILQQREGRKHSSALSAERITQNADAKKAMQDEQNDIKSEIADRSSTSRLLSWIRWALGGFFVLSTSASFAIRVMLGGGAAFLDLAFAIVNVTAVTGEGIATIIDGVLKDKADRRKAELLLIESERQMSTDQMQSEIKQTDEDIQAVKELIETLRQCLQNRERAAMHAIKQ